MLKKLRPSQVLWVITLWIIPFSVFTTLWQGAYFTQGSHNPYLSFSIYLGEIFVFLTLAAWLIEALLSKRKTKFHKKSLIIAGIILASSLISIIFSQDKIASLLAQIHIAAGLSVFLLIKHKITTLRKTQKTLIYALAFQSLLAIAQVILQKSIGLSIIGESLIGADIAGVAKFSLLGKTFIRGYGTLPHANLLAGFLGLGILLTHELPKKQLWRGLKIILWIGFLLAFSKGAVLALIIALLIAKRIPKKIGYSLIGAILITIIIKLGSSETVIERLQYIKTSLAMLIAKPFGVGLSQFTAHLQEFSNLKLQPWQHQPVHNIYFLAGNELGIWAGIGLCGGIIYYLKTHYKKLSFLLFFIVIGFFDHYLISLPQGLMLSGLLIGMTKD